MTEISMRVRGHTLSFSLLDKATLPRCERVNIFASGPSLKAQVLDDDLCRQAAIFVNGSIELLGQHAFPHVVAYVISDARFITHGLKVIEKNYRGQPWFVTLPVLQTLSKHAPRLLQRYHAQIRLIFAVDRPIVLTNTWLGGFFGQKKWATLEKTMLHHIDEGNHFIINKQRTPAIGVSLDINKGFVEAGTVAYVAAQLAFAMQTTQIHLYGVDLINANQPRFYEDNNNKAPCKLDKAVNDRIIPSFDCLAAAYQQRGCTIWNHSAVSEKLFKNIRLYDGGVK